MSNELQVIGIADTNVYAVIRNAAAQVYQTTTQTFVTFVDANSCKLRRSVNRTRYVVGLLRWRLPYKHYDRRNLLRRRVPTGGG
jgi:hypothetical protein